MKRRTILAATLLALCLPLVGGTALIRVADAAPAVYPARPIRLIVPYAAGGGVDQWARLLSGKLAERLGRPVIVQDIPGDGGNTGTAVAARAAADGYTLLLGSSGPLAVHQFTYAALSFDPERDFEPIALLESSPILLVASPRVEAPSAKQLIAWARAHPGRLSYASNGNGSPERVAGELFKARLDLDIRLIPFKSSGPARKAVLTGRAALMFDLCKGAMPAIREGLQKPLAVAAPSRLAQLPDVPTFREIGVQDYDLRIWTGVFAPAGTPERIVMQLNGAIRDVLQRPEIRQVVESEGGQAGATTPQAFSAFLSADRKHWRALVNQSRVPRVP